jgi:hypothetical protein
MRRYIGIDIGKKGAISIYDGSSFIHHKIPMIRDEINYHKLHQLLEEYEAFNGMVVFEKLGVIFGTSKTTAFSMGYQAGAIEMICIALCMPYTKVPAKVWQAEMFQGVEVINKTGKTTRDTKAMALVAFNRLFPKEHTAFDVKNKAHDGLIDAALMAAYAERKFKY